MNRVTAIADNPAQPAATAMLYGAWPHDRAAGMLPGLLLALALLHGLLYLLIVPPWQHYDEPTHFEYVRLIALWDRWPALNETDLATSREIADSMYRFRFWQPGVRPNLFGAQPPNIGISEKLHPPLYYSVAAVPVRWLRHLSIEQQLYAARLIAVLLYLLVVICAWRIATIVAPDRPLIQLIVPLLIILVPAFADQMSAVNNDSLVNFSITALLLGCVLLIRDGLRPLPLLLATLGLAVAVLTKRTALVGALPFGLALLWSIRRNPLRWWAWLAGTMMLGIVVGYAALEYGPAGWTIRPWLADLDRRYLRISLEQIAALLPNWASISPSYPLVFDVLFTSFWVRFGWGNVGMGWVWDWAMHAVVLAGVVGLIAALWSRGGDRLLWQRRVVWLFAVTVLVAWIAAVARFEAQPGGYIPRGRYMHLAIVPTVWLLALGFERVVPRRWRAHSLLGLVLFFAALDLAALGGALSDFYR
ncbi:MAG: hypothetical protein ACJ8CR_02150 [Roseiflexaceae bacterium]